MKIETTQKLAADIEASAIAIFLWKDEPLAGSAWEIDIATEGMLTRLIDAGELSSEPLAVTTLLSPVGVTAKVVLPKREMLSASIWIRWKLPMRWPV